ncbi:hypothetical protein R1sor_002883 [Riccia sorocarpa]|uniref:Uncharacterized protein n=1 Tax=Riccia sorocarpa TaxID=122646 RepID=A0ABD3H1Q5_9MARC
MGLIVDGKVSGNLPDQMAFAVNYPGYPSSVQRAVETLGGEEGLIKARSSPANFLELKFRPEDPYAHPAFGELSHSSDLVLRLTRKTKKRVAGECEPELTAPTAVRQAENDEASEPSEDVRAEIVAKVEHTYSFEGMTDYQYVIAIHAENNRGHKRKGSHQEKGSLLDMEPGELMMLVPPLFSVKDLPEEIFLRPPGGAGVKKPKQTLTEVEAGPEVLVPYALDFKVKDILSIPYITTWKQQLDKSSEVYAWTQLLADMFEERPIWTKNLLNERLIENDIHVTDFTLRRYQGLDFRVPPPLREKSGVPVEPPRWKDLCSFKVVPHKKFLIFQMHDMEDDIIQAEINKPPERSTCGESTGWFRLSTIQRLRLVVRIRFLALYPGQIARRLEDSERRILNRPRPVLRNEDEQKDAESDVPDGMCASGVPEESGEPVIQPFQVESLASEDYADRIREEVSGAKTIEEEEEDEEEEDEEDEEELEEEDEDEEEEEVEDLDARAQDFFTTSNCGLDDFIDTDVADNIPQSYLQALLGKFTFEAEGRQHDGSKDDDYTIFEQDEDEEDD